MSITKTSLGFIKNHDDTHIHKKRPDVSKLYDEFIAVCPPSMKNVSLQDILPKTTEEIVFLLTFRDVNNKKIEEYVKRMRKQLSKL